MPDEAFFLVFGGLGVSLAGFAGLINALDRSPERRSPVAAYRIRNIVVLGFWLTFTGLGTVAVFTVTGGDIRLAVRAGTLLLSVRFLRGLISDTRPGPAWPDDRARRFGILLLAVMLLISLGNVVVANVGYLELVMLMGLIGPVTIFYNTIRAVTAPEPVASE